MSENPSATGAPANREAPGSQPQQQTPSPSNLKPTGNARRRLARIFNALFSVFSVAFAVIAIWLAVDLYQQRQAAASTPPPPAATGTPAPTVEVALPALLQPTPGLEDGLLRELSLHTIIPERPTFEPSKYTVETGDTIFGIAEKYGLYPSTILWGNLNILGDNPHALRPGQELNILPVNGVYYQWHAGDGLNGVSKYFGVKPEDIVNWPGNHLTLESVGDFSKPNIAVGTWLIVPGGKREFISWSAPRISRSNPAVAKVLGPGSCGKVTDGSIGDGVFTWPTTSHLISGFEFHPEANHPAIDIAGSFGNAVYAADDGVIVYNGWNDWGYGNVVVIDHGNGWQTLYAHLNSLATTCGQSVAQGSVIGGLGSTGNSTGPHLHFEMMYNGVKVNPHDYVQ